MYDEYFEIYKKSAKWEGKIFMKDEKTCFLDGLMCGLRIARNTTKPLLKLGKEPREGTLTVDDLKGLESQLTEAKEHIRTLISCLIDWVQEGDKDYCHIAEAEQFLKELEK